MMALGSGEYSRMAFFIVEAGYPGKRPFFVGTFTLDRRASEAEQQAAAETAAAPAIAKFWRDHMPDGIEPPTVFSARLGALKFVADDYEWRRG